MGERANLGYYCFARSDVLIRSTCAVGNHIKAVTEMCAINMFISLSASNKSLKVAYFPKATQPEGPQSPEGPMLPEDPTMPEGPI